MKICMGDILIEVSNYYGVSKNKILEKTRRKTPVLLKHISIYLIKKFTTHSLWEIADYLKYSDHKAVLWGLKNIQNKLKDNDNHLNYDLMVLEKKLINLNQLSY